MAINRRELLTAGVGVGVGMGLMGSAAVAQAGGQNTGLGAIAEGPGGRIPWENSGLQPSTVDRNYKPRRINKAIELWEDGQQVYYVSQGLNPGMDPYELGKKMAKTYADCINYTLEHQPVDFTAFANFMRGLKDGGPTRSGHATPAVFVEPPCTGLNEQYALANTWIINNFLDLGAMGVHICHARDPLAVQVYAQMGARFGIDYPDTQVVPLQGLGLRGQTPNIAPQIWGVTLNKYMHIADVWPLNPRGEIIVGVKIEDRFADTNMAATLDVKGIAFVEHGPTDHVQSLFGLAAYPENESRRHLTPEQTAELNAIGEKVLAECKKNNLKFLSGVRDDPNSPNYVIDRIKAGASLLVGSEKAAQIGREYTKRKMPV